MVKRTLVGPSSGKAQFADEKAEVRRLLANERRKGPKRAPVRRQADRQSR